MKYNTLPNTDIKVSELCFGVLPMGPLQANLPLAEGAELLEAAMRAGVTFFDTAELYQTYPYLRRALDSYHAEVVITSKSAATDYAGMEKAVLTAMTELGRDYIDIFLLHAARDSGDATQNRSGAWQCLQDYKQKGYLRAIGVSTHNVAAVELLSRVAEVDVIFPLINRTGIGLLGGDTQQMCSAIETAAQRGKALYSMKCLGGGNLLDKPLESLSFVRSLPAFSAHAIGMLRLKELDFNLRVFNGEYISPQEQQSLKQDKKWMVFKMLCRHCGACARDCPSQALTMIDDFPTVDPEKCVLCGYCAAACPEFCLRVK